ncbi:16S rRNA pseudouridine(516) synthase [Sporosarcina sp. P37]|uniref:pseudouridine synthase n=1 Tax=unclassified Sporosarcina TaxID=2647733 RepID=UPI000A17F873|nr:MULTISPECIES: pseudouridine synthase [unclassified Sporosarcina]ARK23810.1 16S rRNA pseudouridine(516) synthase [Sporosarcina sp. P37]PID18956.1 rRNA pseudouridine synthase [Sporosarcina sp. P35]
MRLDKLLSNTGYGSRKEVRQLLKKGMIRVNGAVMKDPAQHVDPEQDAISLLGEEVIYREFIYLMMHKPPGVLSATEDNRDQTVIDLLGSEERHFEPFPVGRLDKDTEGLLLLTNDGKLAHNLLSPKKEVPKTYYAKVAGRVTNEDAEAFAHGVVLDDAYETKPGMLNILRSDELSEIELTITEGKFHQVKRMFEAVGKKVVYLKRLTMGPLTLDADLELGDYRELTEEEVQELIDADYSKQKG